MFSLGSKVDELILVGATAEAKSPQPFIDGRISVEGSALLDAWLSLQVGDKTRAMEAVNVLVGELESNAEFDLTHESVSTGRPATVIKRSPPSGAFVLAAFKQLAVLGATDRSAEKRARAVLAKYVGE